MHAVCNLLFGDSRVKNTRFIVPPYTAGYPWVYKNIYTHKYYWYRLKHTCLGYSVISILSFARRGLVCIM